MPTSLGYQPNYGIGGQQISSTPGQNLYPEIQTTRQNTIPSALNKLQTNSSFALETLKNLKSFVPATSAVNTAASGFGASLASSGVKDVSNVIGNINSIGQRGVGQAASKVGLNSLGAITAGIGTVYGLTDMGMQFAANKDHRSAGQMRDTLTKNVYTTDLGNQYTKYGGVNLGNELKYARAQRASRNLNFTASSIGTGMSAGALAGIAAGSAFPIVGTAVGAGAGALLGGLAYLAGFGDTEEETRQAAQDVTDATTMEGRMSESLAKSKDAQQGFYGRTKSGSLGAANGKRPIHARNGYGNAMVSHGEVIGNLNEGWAYREPGVPDNNDTLKRHIAKDDFVISNKYGLSDYAASTGDLVGALQLQDMLMKYNNGKGYKCGKLPKFEGGYWDRALLAIPNIAQILAATQQYNKDKNMPVEAPAVTPDYSSARDQAYAILGDMIPSRPYMNMIDDEVARNKYAISRMPGMGMGGRAVLMDSADKTGLNEKTKQLLNIDEHNRVRRETARKLLANTNAHAEDMRVQTTTDQLNRYARANAVRYNALAQDLKNTVTPFAQWFGDWWKDNQYRIANNQNERKINLFENQQNIDRDWLNYHLNGGNTAATSTQLPSHLKLNTPTMTLQSNQPKYRFNDISTWSGYPKTTLPEFTLPESLSWLPYRIPSQYKYTIPEFKLTR